MSLEGISLKEVKNIDGKIVKVCCRSKNYNYNFYKDDGFHINLFTGKVNSHKGGYFERWGKTLADDPQVAPSPEILDIETSTICKGIPTKVYDKTLCASEYPDGYKLVTIPCPWCYKANTPNGINMSFETFKAIIDKFPVINGLSTLMQVAIGADSEATSNPDLFKMMDYCISKGIAPNITVANISDETADNLAKRCKAIAVSRYANKDICYNSVKKLTDRGMTQINIHHVIHASNYDEIMETLNDKLTDERLSKLNAIVLLSLKKCGRGTNYEILSQDKFKNIVDFAMKNNIGVGFDSCSCHRFLDAIKDYPNYKELEMMGEPCESVLFSSYCSAEGKFYSCSFCENDNFGEGIDVVNCGDFINDVWNNPTTVAFRDKLLKNNRACPVYKIFDKE